SRDQGQGDVLRDAGASEVVPEVLEAGLVMASLALERLGLPAPRIRRLIQDQRAAHYPLLRGHVAGDVPEAAAADRLATTTVASRPSRSMPSFARAHAWSSRRRKRCWPPVTPSWCAVAPKRWRRRGRAC